ncbi:hypothetical protein [Tolypothrix sp. VBCCA 56010]
MLQVGRADGRCFNRGNLRNALPPQCPITNYLFPNAHCPMPIAHCPMPHA